MLGSKFQHRSDRAGPDGHHQLVSEKLVLQRVLLEDVEAAPAISKLDAWQQHELFDRPVLKPAIELLNEHAILDFCSNFGDS